MEKIQKSPLSINYHLDTIFKYKQYFKGELDQKDTDFLRECFSSKIQTIREKSCAILLYLILKGELRFFIINGFFIKKFPLLILNPALKESQLCIDFSEKLDDNGSLFCYVAKKNYSIFKKKIEKKNVLDFLLGKSKNEFQFDPNEYDFLFEVKDKIEEEENKLDLSDFSICSIEVFDNEIQNYKQPVTKISKFSRKKIQLKKSTPKIIKAKHRGLGRGKSTGNLPSPSPIKRGKEEKKIKFKSFNKFKNDFKSNKLVKKNNEFIIRRSNEFIKRGKIGIFEEEKKSLGKKISKIKINGKIDCISSEPKFKKKVKKVRICSPIEKRSRKTILKSYNDILTSRKGRNFEGNDNEKSFFERFLTLG